ncbi:MAG: Hpt domain-containing protein, partial [Thermodesulfobacteriota bacterium]
MKKDIRKERSKEFLVEAEDAIVGLGKDLLALERVFKSGSIDAPLVNRIFRSAHTLKGICCVFDFEDMISLSHEVEDTLDSIRVGRRSLTDTLLGALLGAHSLFERMAASAGEVDFSDELKSVTVLLSKGEGKRRSRRKEDHVDSKLIGLLSEYEEHRLIESIKEKKRVLKVKTTLPLTRFDKEYETLIRLLEIDSEVIATLPATKSAPADMVSIEMLIGTGTELAKLSRELNKKIKSDVKVVSARTGMKKLLDSEGKIEVAPSRAYVSSLATTTEETFRSAADTVRVKISKLDSVMNIVGELSLLKTGISKLSQELKNEKPYSAYGIELGRLEKLLDRKFSELRDSLLDVRMVKIGQLFGRYDTLISRLSRKTGKEVKM